MMGKCIWSSYSNIMLPKLSIFVNFYMLPFWSYLSNWSTVLFNLFINLSLKKMLSLILVMKYSFLRLVGSLLIALLSTFFQLCCIQSSSSPLGMWPVDIFTSALFLKKQIVNSTACIIPLEISCVSSVPFSAVWPCWFLAHKSHICYWTASSMRNNPSVLQMLQTLQFTTKLTVSQ